MRLKKPMLSSRDSAAPGPTSTSMPAARSRSKPWPATSGLGSAMAGHHPRHTAGGNQRIAARAGAALVGAGLQRHIGGGTPRTSWPRGRASRKAITSACGPPTAWVWPTVLPVRPVEAGALAGLCLLIQIRHLLLPLVRVMRSFESRGRRLASRPFWAQQVPTPPRGLRFSPQVGPELLGRLWFLRPRSAVRRAVRACFVYRTKAARPSGPKVRQHATRF
jgi:hypothetical protein